MPHATSLPSPGLQAIILCGPGSSFSTFTANPDEYPKALLPIANRPMVWYPADFCYRMGITNITLICPPSAEDAIKSALATNPHLTSLPLPRPSVLAPKDLLLTTGTAELLRLPEVQALIRSDFVALPCDIVCELPGEKLVEAWMIRAASICNILGADVFGGQHKEGPSGGLGVWYETRRPWTEQIEGEETDFLGVTACTAGANERTTDTLIPHVSKVVYAVPTDSFKDQLHAQKGLQIRFGLIKRHPRVSLMTTKRDAHIYIFPGWVMEVVAENENLREIGEHLVAWWAKAGWQAGLSEKLGMAPVLRRGRRQHPEEEGEGGTASPPPASEEESSPPAHGGTGPSVPPFLAYVQPCRPGAPMIRRVDATSLLLATSLELAKLPSIEEAGDDASPLSHTRKVAYPEGIKPRTAISRADSLLGENVTVETRTSIKESVVGAGCQIGESARLAQCVLMEGVVVGKGCRLTRCVVGHRAVIGNGCVLTDCEVQENLNVEPETEDKGTSLMSSDVLEGKEEETEEDEAEENAEAEAEEGNEVDGAIPPTEGEDESAVVP